jgi:hypothetical protein
LRCKPITRYRYFRSDNISAIRGGKIKWKNNGTHIHSEK